MACFREVRSSGSCVSVKECDSSSEMLENDDDSQEMKIGNASWADAMSKVLGSKGAKTSKSAILSRAKKDSNISWTDKKEDIEMIDDSGKILLMKDKDRKMKNKNTISVKRKEILERQKKKLLWENMGRVKPDITDKERERLLMRIATKGVVQLFNAVQQHQKLLNTKLSKAGKSEVKREKIINSVSKGNFLDMLKGNTEEKNNLKTDPKQFEKCEEQETWSILRDDFMMGATLKDWDRENEEV